MFRYKALFKYHSKYTRRPAYREYTYSFAYSTVSVNWANLKNLCYRTNLFSVKRTISFFLPLSQIFSVWPALVLPLFLQFSLRFPHHRVKSNENLRSAIWKLRGSFFLSLFPALSDWKRTNRKKQVNKDKGRKKWNDAEISVAFSALKRPFYAVLLRFASALAKVNTP